MTLPEIADSLEWFDRCSPEERRAFWVGVVGTFSVIVLCFGFLRRWLGGSRLRELQAKLDNTAAKNAELEQKNAKSQLLDQKLDGLAGSAWFKQTQPSHAPAFVPLVQRGTRIVSVFNLKGGVGKTTIAANLAAVFCRRQDSRKVMMIDADWQGSLTSLCTETVAQLKDVVRGGKLLHRLLERGHSSTSPDELLHLAGETLFPHGRLLGADGTLSQVEDALLVRWITERLDFDPRFVLRQWLHGEAVRQEFNIVIIDCPPRLTVASVAALAASDQVVIPVIPDDLSISAVKVLLNRLREDIIPTVAPHLEVAGIVPNLAGRNGDLSEDRQIALQALKGDAHQALGKPVPVLIEEAIKNFTVKEMGKLYPQLSDNQNTLFERLAAIIHPPLRS